MSSNDLEESRLLSDALDLPSEQREAFLKDRCGTDELYREVRSLLDHYEESFLDDRTPLLEALAQAAEATPLVEAGSDQASASLRPGTAFAERYEVIERLGAGGWGEVFRVHDRVAGQEVALKILHGGLGSGAASAVRLRRELRLVRGLNHPGIVKIHDIGDDNGRMYLVMELLHGQTLRERLKEAGHLSPKEAARILAGVLEALQAAHEAQIVHRDIKPANIFLAETDVGSPTVVLLDFGLARAPHEQRITHTGAFVGTPEYVSPEQARGAVETTPASDLYSTGIVGWEMLTGQPPFKGSTVEVLTAHLNEPPPSKTLSREIAPRWLRSLIAWMLEKQPERRPENAVQVLDRIRSERSPGEGWALYRSLRASRKLLLGLTVTGIGAGLLVAVLYAVFWPVRIERGRDNSERFDAKNKLDSVLHSWYLSGIVPLKATAFSPRYFLGLQGDKSEPKVPTRLVTVDALTGKTTPFALKPTRNWVGGPPQRIPGYDRTFSGTGLLPLSLVARDGAPLFVAGYRHTPHFPGLVVVFDLQGRTYREISQDGRLKPVGAVMTGRDKCTVVLSGNNGPMGMRSVVAGIEVDAAVREAPVLGPPWGPGADFSYYTFLPTAAGTSNLHIDPESHAILMEFTDGIRFEIDPTNGVPLQQTMRSGLTVDEWLASQAKLHNLLWVSTQMAQDGDFVAAGELLEAFSREPAAEIQQTVALARAAQFFKHAEMYERARDLVVRTIGIEPRVAGHARALVDVYARLRQWDELKDQLAWARTKGMPDRNEIKRDRRIAGLYLNQLREVNLNLPELGDALRQGYHYAFKANIMYSLHMGDADEVLKTWQAPGLRQVMPEYGIFPAIANSIAANPDSNRARQELALAMKKKGAGYTVPFALLESYIAARFGETLPLESEIATAVQRQERASFENVFNLYWTPWAQAFASYVEKTRGSTDLAAEYARRARSHHPEAPYLDVVLNAPLAPSEVD